MKYVIRYDTSEGMGIMSSTRARIRQLRQFAANSVFLARQMARLSPSEFSAEYLRYYGDNRSYEDERRHDDGRASDYFKASVGASNCSIQHPVFVKNGKYIEVGDCFSASAGFRIEAWDRYGNWEYAPRITIGHHVCFNYWCHVGAINRIVIQDNVIIGSNVLITDHSHGRLDAEMLKTPARCCELYSKGPVIIEENVWIGDNACVMPGVTISKNSVIGANSVVTKDIPPGVIAVGIPAKVLRSLGSRTV